MSELKEINMISVETLIIIELTDGTKIAMDQRDISQMRKVLKDWRINND